MISVGDLVGKGPDGAGVVRLFRERGYRAVRGNHDEILLAFERGERELSAAHATHRAHADAMSDADWDYLRALGYVIALPERRALVVHAGLVPGVPIEEQSPQDIVKMRSIRADGTPTKRLIEGREWAAAWRGPELVVFGHDALRGLQIHPHALGLDTGCVYGGELTALILEERRFVSVPARRDYVGVRGE